LGVEVARLTRNWSVFLELPFTTGGTASGFILNQVPHSIETLSSKNFKKRGCGVYNSKRELAQG